MNSENIASSHPGVTMNSLNKQNFVPNVINVYTDPDRKHKHWNRGVTPLIICNTTNYITVTSRYSKHSSSHHGKLIQLNSAIDISVTHYHMFLCL